MLGKYSCRRPEFAWLESVTEEEVLDLLPETDSSLHDLVALDQETIADRLEAWEASRVARLEHMTFQVTAGQAKVVRQALARAFHALR